MVPPKPPDAFSPEDRARIIAAVAAYQDEAGISHREMGLVLGCSGSVWSQVRAGKYTGRTDKYVARAAQWLAERSGRSPEGLRAEYVETSAARAIAAVCTRAWQMSRLGLVLARAGLGKTRALEEFCRRRGRWAVMLRVAETINSRRGILEELVRRFAVKTLSRPTTDEMGRAVREHLAKAYAGGKGTPYCILVDEATRIKAGPMSVLRELSDDPACRAAVVLAGTWELHSLLRQSAWVPGGTDQVRSRIAAVYAVRPDEPVPLEDVRAVAESVLRTMGLKTRIDPKALAYLGEVAAGDGALRAVENRLWACRDAAEAAGHEPTFSARELDYAATMLFDQPQTFEHRELPFTGRKVRGEAEAKRATA